MQYEMLSYCHDTIRRVGSKIVQVQMVECSTCQKGRQIDDSFSEKFRVSELHDIIVAFWVTNPCRITRKVKQTKMYVCTLEEFILVDIWIHCCASWKWFALENAVVYIQSQQWMRKDEINS